MPVGLPNVTYADLQRENELLRRQLDEAEATIHAIHIGRVDAFLVHDDTREQVFVMNGCDVPYRLLVERMEQGAGTITRDGSIIYFNQNFLSAMGYAEQSLAGLSIVDFVSAEYKSTFHRLLERAANDGADEELVLLRRDGSTFHGRVTISPMLREMEVYCLIVTDLTPRREQEEARVKYVEEKAARTEAERMAAMLRESEYQFRTLADSAPVLIWINSLEGREFVNREYLDFLGVDESEAKGHNWGKFIHPDDHDRYMQAYFGAMMEQGVFDIQFRLRRHDGEYRWVKSIALPRFDADRNLIGYAGSTVDIDDMKRVESELRSTRQQLQLITDTMGAAVTRVSKDLRYEWANKGYAAWQHSAPEDILGKTVEEVLGPEGLKGIQPYVDRVLSGESVEYEAELTLKNVGTRWVHCTYEPTHDADGRVDGWVAVVSDVTPRKELEVALQNAHDRLEEMVRERTAELIEANAKYRAMYDQGLFAGLMTTDGILIDANRSSLEQCGFTREDVIGKPFWDVGWWNRSAGVQAWLKAGFARALTGQVFSGESVYFVANGEERFVDFAFIPIKDESGNVIYVAPTGLDITDRKRAEQERRAAEVLRESEQRYRQLVHSLPAAVYTCDAEGRIRLFNDAAVALWGRKPKIGAEQWCGSFKIFRPDGSPMPFDECPMAVALREQRAVKGEEIIVEREDGSRRYVLPHPEPIYDSNGKMVGAINMLIDITDRKLAEAELAATKDDLALQVRALTQLHDLAIGQVESEDLPGTLRAVLRTTVDITGADFGIIYLYDDQSGYLDTVGFIGYDGVDLSAIAHTRPGEFGGPCGLAFTNGSRAIVEDIESDPRFSGVRDVARTMGFRAVHSTPIVSRSGSVIGVLSVQFLKPRIPSNREIQISDLCARHAADVIDAANSRQALLEANDTLERRVAERTIELRELAVELTHTEHRERKRLAMALHDEVQQLLVAVKMQASAAKIRPEPTGAIQEVLRLTDEAIACCRALVVGLSPPMMCDAGLIDTLNWLARQVRDQHGLTVNVDVVNPPPHVAEDLCALLYEISRELLFNVVKHAGVDEASITLNFDGESAFIQISDKGNGCEMASLERPARESFGLFSVRERLMVVGGTLSGQSKPGDGCCMRVTVPIPELD